MSVLVRELTNRPDISRPKWDQSTFDGRFKHFFTITNPLNMFLSSSRIDEYRRIVQSYRKGEIPSNLTVAELWRAKHVCDAAFHPETGESLFVLGRITSKVPSNMLIFGCMLTFNKKRQSVIFWQWINQTYNAGMNYSNRAGENAPTGQRLLTAYLCATGGAVGSALWLGSLAKQLPPIAASLVPFVSVALANVINIPIIRANEFTQGITVETESGEKLGKSTYVARHAIGMVVFSRISISIPSLVVVPLVTQRLARQSWFKNRPWVAAPVQTALTGFVLLFTTPFGCALFPQRSAIKVDRLEEPLRQEIAARRDSPKVVYYNKGL